MDTDCFFYGDSFGGNCVGLDVLLLYRRFPKIAFNNSFPILRSNPPLVVGIPVFRANDCFAPLSPMARFQENENPNLLPIIFKL